MTVFGVLRSIRAPPFCARPPSETAAGICKTGYFRLVVVLRITMPAAPTHAHGRHVPITRPQHADRMPLPNAAHVPITCGPRVDHMPITCRCILRVMRQCAGRATTRVHASSVPTHCRSRAVGAQTTYRPHAAHVRATCRRLQTVMCRCMGSTTARAHATARRPRANHVPTACRPRADHTRTTCSCTLPPTWVLHPHRRTRQTVG